MSASMRSSSASASLKPSGPNSLIPLSGNGLCEAESTAPMSARCSRTSTATPGVGSTPARSAIPPAEAMPAHSASSSSGPDRRVSRPTSTTGARSATPRSRTSRTAAEPSASASCGLRDGLFATPRTPSVPNSRPLTRPLALRELRAPAGGLQAGLLALDLARVAGQEALPLQLGAHVRIRLDQRPGDGRAPRAALPGVAAAVAAGVDVEAILQPGQHQRRERGGAVRRAAEVVLERAAVQGHRARAALEDDARDRRLALAGAALRGVLCQLGLAPVRPRRAASGSGPRADARGLRTA